MHWLENWLLPSQCALTGDQGAGLDLSQDVIDGLMSPRRVCPVCCEPSQDRSVCGACLATPPPVDRSQVGFYFEGDVQTLIHGLKYGKQLSHARILAELMVPILDASHVQGVMAVPLHPKRWRSRGFNQAQLIAEVLSRELDVPIVNNAVKRVKQTPTQTGLTARQRKQNLQGAFQVDPERLVGMESIALVDDVMTTNATMNALASELKRRSTLHYLEAWAVAKTA